jgi:hypothetical protein
VSVLVPQHASGPQRTRWSRSRVVWHTIGLILAALLAYAVWRGYQNPDFLLDLGNLRLCGQGVAFPSPGHA